MTKNLLFLLVFLTAVGYSTVNAQCTRDPIAVQLGVPGFYPNPLLGALPNGTVGSAYNEDITVIAPADTTIDLTPFGVPLTQTVGINTLTITALTGAPAGIDFANCDPVSCGIAGGDDGCFQIDGTPTAAGVYSVGVEVTINIDIPGLGPFDLPSFAFATYDLEIGGGVAIDPNLNANFQVEQNAPNPYNEITKIDFNTPNPGNFTFEVLDMVGHKLHSESFRANAGSNSIQFDGSKLAPGLYVYRLNDGEAVVTHTMMVGR